MENTQKSIFGLQVDHHSISSLLEAAKWAKFIAIACLAGISLVLLALLIVFISGGVNFSDNRLTDLYNLPSWVVSAGLSILSVILLVGLFYYYQLLNFANKTKMGLQTKDQQQLAKASQSLKVYMMLAAAFAILGLLYNLLINGYAFYLRSNF